MKLAKENVIILTNFKNIGSDYLKILKIIYSFIKKKVGNRPSDMPNMEIGKWVVEGLKGYENIPDNIKFVDLMQKENKK